MKKRKILSLLLAFICIVCMSIPAFAHSYTTPNTSGSTGYDTPTTSGTSPYSYQSGSNGYGYNYNQTPTQTQSMLGSGNTSNGSSQSGYMPGSGVSNQSDASNNQSGGIPGSGTNSASSSTTGTNSGSGNPNTAGSTGGGAGDYFGASVGSDGPIQIELPGATGVSAGDPTEAMKTVFQKYKIVGTAVIAICLITAILSLLVQITKLGAAGDNERMRTAALKGIIYSGAVISAFGALAVVVGFFWNALV